MYIKLEQPIPQLEIIIKYKGEGILNETCFTLPQADICYIGEDSQGCHQRYTIQVLNYLNKDILVNISDFKICFTANFTGTIGFASYRSCVKDNVTSVIEGEYIELSSDTISNEQQTISIPCKDSKNITFYFNRNIQEIIPTATILD